MSLRLISNQILRHGKVFLKYYCKRTIYANIYENGKRTIVDVVPKIKNQNIQQHLRKDNGLFRFGQHARKLFVDNILNKVKPIYSAELRNHTKNNLFYGDSVPFLTLIGVSLASGTGILSKENDLEVVCSEIREAASRVNEKLISENLSAAIDENFKIDQLDVGPPIAKGSAAVVYAAAFKAENKENLDYNNLENTLKADPGPISSIHNISRFIYNYGTSSDNLRAYLDEISVNLQLENECDKNTKPLVTKKNVNDHILSTKKPETLNFNKNSEFIGQHTEDTTTEDVISPIYPLALKMMFNYDIQSNSIAILKAMHRETIPAQYRSGSLNHVTHNNNMLLLPPHPNIVKMFGYFCGEIKDFRDGHILYPVAQPARINPNGYGRNMSLYLVMKRYKTNLSDYLDTNCLNMQNRILIFAQLLEAVAHINRHGIAHRDLKLDNILIEMNKHSSTPLLVISDFGCCLADNVNGLQIPYNSDNMDKGGNAALMAPEIITKVPGPFRVLNFEKSDLWAVGAIGYEIFGLKNPFYKYDSTDCLQNYDYVESDLPDLPKNIPILIQLLIKNFLKVNPSARLTPDVAANVMQIFLWGPKSWLKSDVIPTNTEILQWLLSLTIKVTCDSKIYENETRGFEFTQNKSYIEYVLISSFLSRSRLKRIRGALSWIHNMI